MSINPQDFSLMYTRLYKVIYYFVLFKTKEPEVSKDIVQEVFFTAFKTWGEVFDEQKSKAFLLVIAKSRIIDHFKSAHNRYTFVPSSTDIEGEEVSYFENISSPEKIQEDWFEEGENKKIAMDMLEQISEKDRQILTARYLEDMSYREISQVYEISEESARKKVERALNKIRDNIK